MKEEIKTKMTEAQADARIVMAGNFEDFASPEAKAAYKAMQADDRNQTATSAYECNIACQVWIDTHPAIAIRILDERIAKRAAKFAGEKARVARMYADGSVYNN
jgi:hypothetical protein